MISSRVLIDTGSIVAVLRRDDEHHAVCSKELEQLPTPLLTCWPVLTEAAWLLRRYPRQVRQLLDRCGGHPFEIVSLSSGDLREINAILGKYEDQGIQLADAALMHLAERERIEHVFTLDRRHFSVYRTAAGKTLTLVP